MTEPPSRPSVGLRTAPPTIALREQRSQLGATSFWVWVGASLTAVFTAGMALTQIGRMHSAVADVAKARFPHADPTSVNHVADVSVAVVVGGGVFLVLLELAIACAMRPSQRWARILIVVLTVVTTLYSLLLLGEVTRSVLAGAYAATRAGLLLYVSLAIAACILTLFGDTRSRPQESAEES